MSAITQNNKLNGINPLVYQGVNATQPPQVLTSTATPSISTKQYPIGTLWLKNTGSSAVLYMYVGVDSSTGHALWPTITLNF